MALPWALAARRLKTSQGSHDPVDGRRSVWRGHRSIKTRGGGVRSVRSVRRCIPRNRIAAAPRDSSGSDGRQADGHHRGGPKHKSSSRRARIGNWNRISRRGFSATERTIGACTDMSQTRRTWVKAHCILSGRRTSSESERLKCFGIEVAASSRKKRTASARSSFGQQSHGPTSSPRQMTRIDLFYG